MKVSLGMKKIVLGVAAAGEAGTGLLSAGLAVTNG